MNQAKQKKMHVTFEGLHRKDFHVFHRMVFSLYREDPCGERMSRRNINRSVHELSSHPEKGTIYVFRYGASVVGYAIVINYWSNEYGGNILSIDELFIKPDWRGKRIGTSFIDYLTGLKGRCTKGIQVEATPTNKNALAFYNSRGFQLSKNLFLLKTIG
jgi:GNAT superfamily N-acetyltransferase